MKPSVQPPRTPSRLSDSVHHQLNIYALAASAAGVGILALAQPAEAKIVYTKTNTVVHEGTPLELQNNGVKDFVFQSFDNCVWGFCRDWLSFCDARANNRFEAQSGLVVALRPGVVIGPKAAFPKYQSTSTMAGLYWVSFSSGRILDSRGFWINVKNRYIGLKFRIGKDTHYGWARLNVSWDSKNGIVGTLTGYAYETVPKKPSIAGNTKDSIVTTVQPATLGHLARGASTLSAWRENESAANR